MNVSAVSFDVDMTLIDTDGVIIRSMKSVRDELLNRLPSDGELRISVEEMFAIRNQVEDEVEDAVRDFDAIRLAAFERILRQAGITEPELAVQLNEKYLERRFDDMEPYEDAVPTLDALAPRFKLGLLSNGNNYPEYYGLEGRFDFAVFAQDVRIEKPDQRIFQIAAGRAGCVPDRLLHVGDSLVTDVAGAQAVGAQGVWLNREGRTNDTEIKPDCEIRSLTELRSILERK